MDGDEPDERARRREKRNFNKDETEMKMERAPAAKIPIEVKVTSSSRDSIEENKDYIMIEKDMGTPSTYGMNKTEAESQGNVQYDALERNAASGSGNLGGEGMGGPRDVKMAHDGTHIHAQGRSGEFTDLERKEKEPENPREVQSVVERGRNQDRKRKWSDSQTLKC